MNPSAIQMMPSPVSDAPLFKEGSALAGRSVKSPDGFPAWGMNQASRPAAPEKPAFSQILAEQKAEPPAEKAGQEKTAVNGPAFSEPVEAEGMEKPETASGEDQIPAGQPEIPSPVAVRTTPPSGMTDAEVPGTLPGPGTPPVKSLPSLTFEADAAGRWTGVLADAWPDPKLWSPWEPNLYWYSVELRDAEERLVDAVLP